MTVMTFLCQSAIDMTFTKQCCHTSYKTKIKIIDIIQKTVAKKV